MALQFTSVQNETIAAIATGISESGIGIIRISGPDAIAVGEKLYRNRYGRSDVASWKANTIHFGYIVDPAKFQEKLSNCFTEERRRTSYKPLSDRSGKDFSDKAASCGTSFDEKSSGKRNLDKELFASAIVDEVMVSIMRAPHSYTTEDTIEINCHGGVYLMQRVLQLCLANGCRLAEPGEFTKRAFLGGRIDLSQAEAVMDLIDSRNEFSRRTALAQLEGSVSGKIKALREDILYEIAFIESALDDPENYSLDGYPQKLRKKCVRLIQELNQILSDSASGRMLKEGIRTVIVGKPNAGKSSLMNYLAGEERAIVTDVAGTTRDTLEESIRVDDLVLDLIDTAGIHETSDKVEKIGVNKARKALVNADLILFLVDLSVPLEDADREIASLILDKIRTGAKCIVLLNKSDLSPQISREEAAGLFASAASDSFVDFVSSDSGQSDHKGQFDNNEHFDNQQTQSDHAIARASALYFLPISITTQAGLKDFRQLLQQMFCRGDIMSKNDIFLSSIREQQEATSARDALQLVTQSIDQGLSEDFYSIDLMTAYTELGKILGESVEDDLVEEIFSKFCMGK